MGCRADLLTGRLGSRTCGVLHESIKITGSESGVRKATAHFRVSTQTWRGYIQEKILLLPLMIAALLNL